MFVKKDYLALFESQLKELRDFQKQKKELEVKISKQETKILDTLSNLIKDKIKTE